MKKFCKVSLWLFVFIAVFSCFCFAQDSTGVVSAADTPDDIFSFLVSFIPVKYQAIVFTTLLGLFLLEQWLAANTKLKENSTFQLVAGWIKALWGAVKIKK